MTREILTSLGYPRDRLPDNMRRTVALVANAIASLALVANRRQGNRVQKAIGREHFRGIRVCINGDIPRGGLAAPRR